MQRVFLFDCFSVTELAREQPLDGSLTNAKSNDASTAVSAANVLPSPDVLNSLDMIHSWLQQSERHAVTEAEEMTSVNFAHTSILPSAGIANSQSEQLQISTSSWQTAAVNVSTVWCFFTAHSVLRVSKFCLSLLFRLFLSIAQRL